MDISHSARAPAWGATPSPLAGISGKSSSERLLRRTAVSGGFGAGISENSERAARIAGTANTYAAFGDSPRLEGGRVEKKGKTPLP